MSDNPFDLPESNPFNEPPPEPNMGGMKKYVAQNIKDSIPGGPGESTDPAAKYEGKPDDFYNAFMAGLQISTAGLATRMKMPDRVLPDDAGMALRITKQAGTLAGDI